MNFQKRSVAAAIAVAMGTAGFAGTASAVTFTFANNTGATAPTNTLLGFGANTEFHVLSPYGSTTNDGDKDVISGGEQWVFTGDTAGSQMTGVASTSTNSGGGGENATLTTGVAGFPVASTAGTVATLQQGASFLQTNNIFTMGAPLTGNILGQTFGAGTVDDGTTAGFTQAGTFSINLPVVHTQWATGSYIIGGDPNANPANGDKCQPNGPCGGPGVTLSGTTNGSGNFTLSGSYRMTKDEVSVAGFNNNYVEWSLQGTYAADGGGGPAPIPVPAAAWLFGSGLMGMVGVARRRRRKA
jgi:hypothetical protein